MTVKYNPPSSCILEISVKGIKLAVHEDYYARDKVCTATLQQRNLHEAVASQQNPHRTVEACRPHVAADRDCGGAFLEEVPFQLLIIRSNAVDQKMINSFSNYKLFKLNVNASFIKDILRERSSFEDY